MSMNIILQCRHSKMNGVRDGTSLYPITHMSLQQSSACSTLKGRLIGYVGHVYTEHNTKMIPVVKRKGPLRPPSVLKVGTVWYALQG
jgi:hypothetical protein